MPLGNSVIIVNAEEVTDIRLQATAETAVTHEWSKLHKFDLFNLSSTHTQPFYDHYIGQPALAGTLS